MNLRLKKVLLLLLAGALLAGIAPVQNSLNRDRERLGLTRKEPLENAPPMLAFTTVALGGFRGLIANALWIRASDLQDQDRFFEMVQLSDWITKLEPHFAQVWANQAWNMAYNISIKFKDFPDRWRWVERGIQLLRDEGIRYNPNETLLYRELAWFFQHKIGATVDDAHMFYKQVWADQLAEVFDYKDPDLDELINPGTDDARRRATLLREKFKMDPVFMKEVDRRHGPLEWRLPEAHAIYWAAVGLEQAKANPDKVKADELIMLRRVIYQSMLTSFHRGRLESNPYERNFQLNPNLDIVEKVNAAYEEMQREDAANRDHIGIGHRNFLRDAVYFLYVNNRMHEAAEWYRYLAQHYPDKALFDNDTNSYPRNLTVDQFAVARVQEAVSDASSRERVTAMIQGLLVNSYRSLVLDEEDRSVGFSLLAQRVWEAYQSRVPTDRMAALGLTPMNELKQVVVDRLLDPERGLHPQMRAVLRTRLNLPAEPPAPTQTPPATAPAARGQ